MATAAEKQRHRDLVAACDLCDRSGWRLDAGGRDGDRPARCRHERLTAELPAGRDFTEPTTPHLFD